MVAHGAGATAVHALQPAAWLGAAAIGALAPCFPCLPRAVPTHGMPPRFPSRLLPATCTCCCTRCPQEAATLRQQKASGWLPKVGQSVFVPRLGKRAKVVAADAASGALTLQAGLIKIQAAADEVRQQ